MLNIYLYGIIASISSSIMFNSNRTFGIILFFSVGSWITVVIDYLIYRSKKKFEANTIDWKYVLERIDNSESTCFSNIYSTPRHERILFSQFTSVTQNGHLDVDRKLTDKEEKFLFDKLVQMFKAKRRDVWRIEYRDIKTHEKMIGIYTTVHSSALKLGEQELRSLYCYQITVTEIIKQ